MVIEEIPPAATLPAQMPIPSLPFEEGYFEYLPPQQIPLASNHNRRIEAGPLSEIVAQPQRRSTCSECGATNHRGAKLGCPLYQFYLKRLQEKHSWPIHRRVTGNPISDIAAVRLEWNDLDAAVKHLYRSRYHNY